MFSSAPNGRLNTPHNKIHHTKYTYTPHTHIHTHPTHTHRAAAVDIFVNELKSFSSTRLGSTRLGSVAREHAWRVDFYVPSMKWHLINIIFIDHSEKTTATATTTAITTTTRTT